MTCRRRCASARRGPRRGVQDARAPQGLLLSLAELPWSPGRPVSNSTAVQGAV